MLDPISGRSCSIPARRDGSRGRRPRTRVRYLERHPVHVSTITKFERVRGYALLARDESLSKRQVVERARLDYLADLGSVWPVDEGVASTAAEICALLPHAPTPPRHAHQFVESRQERLARWRADTIIAATDFETTRGAIEREPARLPGLGPLKLIRCLSVFDSGRV